jgi:hypothetical protein
MVLVFPAHAAVFNIAAGDVAGLINAINTANANNEDDTINLAQGTYALTAVNNDTDGPNGLPSITSAITIHGAGANDTVLARADGTPEFRILHVATAGVLTIDGLTVTGAKLSGTPATFNGGILNKGTLTLRDSAVSANVVGNISGFAGGISNIGAMLTLLNSTVSNNRAENDPAGISNASGTLMLLNSTVSGNFSGTVGGIGNTGFVGQSLMTAVNSTISNNFGSDTAGGISNVLGTVNLLNSTITGNTTAQHSIAPSVAGVLNDGGTMTVNHSIILGNSTLDRENPTPTPLFPSECLNFVEFVTSPGQITSLGHNLVATVAFPEIFQCPSDGPGDLTVDPANVFTTVLGPLQNNGGSTETHALLPGSPAIDAGAAVCTDASGAPLTTDQRGRPRPIDGNGDGMRACDIGAFEFFPTVNNLVTLAPSLKTSLNATPVAGGPAGTFTITATFTNTSSTPLHALFFGVSQLSGANLLLNADGGPGGVGATLTPKISGDVLALGASVTVEFVVGLQKQGQFTFFVNVFGEPVL